MRPFDMRHGKAPGKTQKAGRLYQKLRLRLTLYFFLFVALPCLVFTTAAYTHTRMLMESDEHKAALAGVYKEKSGIGRYISELEAALSAAADSIPPSELTRLSGLSVFERQSVSIAGGIDENFTIGQQSALLAAYIINRDGIKASYGPYADQAAISAPQSQQWFSGAVRNPGAIQLLGTVQRFYTGGASKAVLCAAKSLKSHDENIPPAVMLFDFDYSLFTDFIEDRSPDGSSIEMAGNLAERIIIDSDGNILYSRNRGKLTTKVGETLRGAVGDAGNGFKRIIFNGADYYLTYVRYPEFNWIFINLNKASNVTGRLWLRSPLMTGCLIALPVILLLYLVLSIKLMKPINDLTSVISDYENQYSGGSRQLSLLNEKKPDLSSDTASDIDLLINKIYSIRLSQKEAELNSLQNQINPHFLYNTLESIRGAALYHGIHDIAAMSRALSLLFRYSISERVLVTIREELQHLENYISIQNFRYENKFEMVYSIPQELMDYKILKLTLQPLIENSIRHGLEMKIGKGTIRIEILELDNNIKIQVSDDGLGIAQKKLEELNRMLTSDRYRPEGGSGSLGTGIGVVNVNSRIKLYFGEQYGLKFGHAFTGTTVEITLPAVADKREA